MHPTYLQILFSPTGRLNRQRYWVQSFLTVMAISVFVQVIGLSIGEEVGAGAIPLLIIITGLALASCWISVVGAIKRLRDRDMSGWWYLIGFIPLLGGIALLILMCLKGTEGANRFGPDLLLPEPNAEKPHSRVVLG